MVSNIKRLPKENYEMVKIDGKHITRNNLEQLKVAFRKLSEKITVAGETFTTFVESFKGQVKIGQSLTVYAVRVKNRELVCLFGEIV